MKGSHIEFIIYGIILFFAFISWVGKQGARMRDELKKREQGGGPRQPVSGGAPPKGGLEAWFEQISGPLSGEPGASPEVRTELDDDLHDEVLRDPRIEERRRALLERDRQREEARHQSRWDHEPKHKLGPSREARRAKKLSPEARGDSYGGHRASENPEEAYEASGAEGYDDDLHDPRFAARDLDHFEEDEDPRFAMRDEPDPFMEDEDAGVRREPQVPRTPLPAAVRGRLTEAQVLMIGSEILARPRIGRRRSRRA